MITGMDWVRVESEKELRQAVLVELRPCGFCGKTERFMLLHQAGTGSSLTADGDFQKAGSSWTIAPGLCINPKRPFDPSAAIATGRLWRRADVAKWDQRTVTAGDRVHSGGARSR